MRKITEQANIAFSTGENWKSSNTQVRTSGSKTELLLHGNKIAQITTMVGVVFSLAGWNTPTTRERLQAAGVVVKQKGGVPYFVSAIGSGAPEQELDSGAVYLVQHDRLVKYTNWMDVDICHP